MRNEVRAKMAEIERMSNAELLAALKSCNPFAGYIGNNAHRTSNMGALLRYEFGGRLEDDEGWE